MWGRSVLMRTSMVFCLMIRRPPISTRTDTLCPCTTLFRSLGLMERESNEIATIAGLAVGRVAVGDPRSRWGSCTHDGDLRYSWRLVMAPDHVRRATVAHEVAHLRHMDHGAAFHALVDELHDGDVAAAREIGRAHV